MPVPLQAGMPGRRPGAGGRVRAKRTVRMCRSREYAWMKRVIGIGATPPDVSVPRKCRKGRA
ncbi:hypothetical protein FGU65_12365 [Methanoculleus sp. FWC-SCC1]|uniref:Uncharacterized protein n=1 Tax=Methanoculleus frigidifontis TaxID=2584085 RepID=A0ABT8MCL5_9EURY|nr:hypothetical protein [Methanoculleus sp. FWC-SCC1]MDN7025671.1 hypothetical protein [Methanoculleus sp. FWC-SCC1]